MPPINTHTDLPVLLLHNLDASWPADDIQAALCGADQLESSLRELGHPVTSLPIWDAGLAAQLRDFDPRGWIVLNWCEGLPGIPHSDAHVARALRDAGFAYTGASGPVLSLSWDKAQVKRSLEVCGLPTPRWRIYNRARADDWDCFPAIVKPAREHCSVGVTSESVVLAPDELQKRIEYVLDVFGQSALVEDFIDGREFHVPILGDGSLEVLPAVEMDFHLLDDVHDRLCTYDAKFTPGSLHYEQISSCVPAPLDPIERVQLERIAVAAYRAIGCRDYGRLDIRLRDGVFYVLDVNPNADISADASIALAAAVIGYSYGEMISLLVNLAARRHPRYRVHWF